MKKLTFQHFLIFSLIAHIILFIIILSDKILFKKEIHTAAVRIDTVRLPDILPSKKRKIIKKEKKSIVKKTIGKKRLNKKALVKKDTDKKNKKTKNKESSDINKKKKYEGNKISKGSGFDKDGTEEIANIYVTEITEIIKNHWNIPRYMKNQNLTTELEIQIDQAGRLTTKKIIKSSQNPNFDTKALEAIQNATPFPKPPSESWKLIKDGIVFILNSNDNG